MVSCCIRQNIKLLLDGRRNTREVIDWFNGLEDKSSLSFLKFDIESYFPSITKELLVMPLDFVLEEDFLDETEKELIFHCRRSILVGPNGNIWLKSNGEEFDVTMGSMDSAEISETVGLLILNKMARLFPKELFGLYRDDGMAAIRGGPQEVERWTKKLFSLFKDFGLKITPLAATVMSEFLNVISENLILLFCINDCQKWFLLET